MRTLAIVALSLLALRALSACGESPPGGAVDGPVAPFDASSAPADAVPAAVDGPGPSALDGRVADGPGTDAAMRDGGMAVTDGAPAPGDAAATDAAPSSDGARDGSAPDAASDGAAPCVEPAVSGVPLAPSSDVTHTVCATGCDYSTISGALATAMPGWTIEVKTGTYVESIAWTRSGTPGHPIALVAAPGAHPVISPGAGANPVPSSAQLSVSANWILIDGFEITDSGVAGIHLQPSNHTTIRNNYIHANCGTGLEVAAVDPSNPATDVLVEGNTIELNGTPSNGQTNCGNLQMLPEQSHGIYLSEFYCSGLERITIRRNRFVQSGGAGIQWNGFGHLSPGAPESECPSPGISDVTVENNLFEDNRAGFYMYHAVYNTIVRNNTFVIDPARLPTSNEHNPTFISMWGTISGALLENNVFYSPTVVSGTDSVWPLYVDSSAAQLVNVRYDYNVWDVAPTAPFLWHASSVGPFATHYASDTGWDAHGRCCSADPSFVSPSTGDLHLGAGSSAHDDADPAACPAVDHDGRCRAMDPSCDVGAYESP